MHFRANSDLEKRTVVTSHGANLIFGADIQSTGRLKCEFDSILLPSFDLAKRRSKRFRPFQPSTLKRTSATTITPSRRLPTPGNYVVRKLALSEAKSRIGTELCDFQRQDVEAQHLILRRQLRLTLH